MIVEQFGKELGNRELIVRIFFGGGGFSKFESFGLIIHSILSLSMDLTHARLFAFMAYVTKNM